MRHSAPTPPTQDRKVDDVKRLVLNGVPINAAVRGRQKHARPVVAAVPVRLKGNRRPTGPLSCRPTGLLWLLPSCLPACRLVHGSWTSGATLRCRWRCRGASYRWCACCCTPRPQRWLRTTTRGCVHVCACVVDGCAGMVGLSPGVVSAVARHRSPQHVRSGAVSWWWSR